MLLTLRGGPESLAPRAHRIPVYPIVFPHSSIVLSRRTVRFWTSVLRQGPGPISIRVGEQWMEVSTSPAFVQQAYGIEGDQKDLLRLLDQEAPLIAELEDQTDELEDIVEDIDEDDVIDAVPWDEESEEDDTP